MRKRRTKIFLIILVIVLPLLFILFNTQIMTGIGKFLVKEEILGKCEAVVVLNSGVEIYPRLIQAAELHNNKICEWIVINGNRKTDVLRELERDGFRECCAWYENHFRILEVCGVPREKIIAISAEDVYDTISEAREVGNVLLDREISSVIIVTSKYHTRRARYIWEKHFGDKLKIRVTAASTDPFVVNGWWKDGRQIRWVLSEYGAWVYYWWNSMKRGDVL
jgi:uncharacterized SAM-binding protein YcdF (DUF218 family)